MITKHKILSLIGALTAIGLAALGTGQASAVAPVAPSVGFELGAAKSEHYDPDQTQVLTPGLEGVTTDHYWVPLTIKLTKSAEYSVTAQAATPGLKDLSNANNTAEIASIDGDSTLSQMVNQWGFRYKKGDGTGDTFPSSDTTSYQSLAGVVQIQDDTAQNGFMKAPSSGSATWIFDFGAGVNGTLPSGQYGTNVTISVVATPETLPLFYTIETMQEMSDAVCKSVPTPLPTQGVDVEGSNLTYDTTGTLSKAWMDTTPNAKSTFVPQTTLYDSRDGTSYLIRKLADGNCWMVQNLELDFLSLNNKYSADVTVKAKPVTFTNQDTDLPAGVTSWTWDGTNSTTGKPFFATQATSRTSQNTTYGWADDGTDGFRSYSYPGTVKACAGGAINSTYLDNPANVAASVVCPNDATNWNYSKINALGSNSAATTFKSEATGEPYERYGNLYNWTLATLGYGLSLSTDGQEATGSICPKGWRLPQNSTTAAGTVGTVTDGTHKTWANLLGLYGLPTVNTDNNIPYFNKMPNAPLNFLRSGYYHRSNGCVSARETGGHWWSSTAGSATYAHYLSTWPSGVSPQSNYYRGGGYAVRCVAR